MYVVRIYAMSGSLEDRMFLGYDAAWERFQVETRKAVWTDCSLCVELWENGEVIVQWDWQN